MEKYKILDLFSGLGGFSLGLERTGHFETVAFCDNNQYSKLILDSIIYSSIYLIIIDKFAIDNFTWIINKNYTINFFTDYIATIPLEEIIFFIVTSTMCNLGFTLFMCIIIK